MDYNILLNPYYESILKYDPSIRGIDYEIVVFGKLNKNIYDNIKQNEYSHVYFVDIFGNLYDLDKDQYKNLECLVTECPHVDITGNLDYDYANADNTYIYYTNSNTNANKSQGSFLDTTESRDDRVFVEDSNDYTLIDTSEFSSEDD